MSNNLDFVSIPDETRKEDHSFLPPLTMPDNQAGNEEMIMEELKWIDEDISIYYLSPDEQAERPNYTLSYDNCFFAPLGGIQALTGQSGHGKTMLITQFIAAILNGSLGRLRYEGPTPTPSVLYIDTEMEKGHTIAVRERVCRLVGQTAQDLTARFKILRLREVLTSQQRFKIVLKAIFELRPTVCFIDGLLDLVEDFNDNNECQEMIYKVMKIASFYNISLWCLVHENPGSTKMVGHLGSFLERKSTDVFCVRKDKSEDEIKFKVEQRKARSRDLPDWYFHVIQDEDRLGLPEQMAAPTNEDQDIDTIRKLLQAWKDEIEWPAYGNNIKEIFKKHGGIKRALALQRTIEKAKNRRFIIEQPKEEWSEGQKYPKYYLNQDFNNDNNND